MQAATGRLRKSKSNSEELFIKRMDYPPIFNAGLKEDGNVIMTLIQRPLVSTETSPCCPQNLDGSAVSLAGSWAAAVRFVPSSCV